MNYFFNQIDTDKNGVITFPEFTKLALDFSESEEDTANLVFYRIIFPKNIVPV